jgi:hypothetical protein
LINNHVEINKVGLKKYLANILYEYMAADKDYFISLDKENELLMQNLEYDIYRNNGCSTNYIRTEQIVPKITYDDDIKMMPTNFSLSDALYFRENRISFVQNIKDALEYNELKEYIDDELIIEHMKIFKNIVVGKKELFIKSILSHKYIDITLYILPKDFYAFYYCYL